MRSLEQEQNKESQSRRWDDEDPKSREQRQYT